jgi:hypothetical protein
MESASLRVARRGFLWAAMALVAVLACHVAAAGADVVSNDGTVKVVFVGAAHRNFGAPSTLSGTHRPVFKIQVLQPNTPIQCQTNGVFSLDRLTACGTQQSTGCPAYQCWTYSPTVHDAQFNALYVNEEPPEFVWTDMEIDYTTYTKPPQTRIATPPDVSERYVGSQVWEHPLFSFSDPSSDPLPVTFRCTLSAPSGRPGRWRSCRLPRLRLTGVYRLRARAVDVFGRPDPTPAQYIFSPTPCRVSVHGRLPSYSRIRQHGLPLTIACIQPSHFETDLTVPYSWQYSCHGNTTNSLGFIRGRTTRGRQALHITLHTFPCAPTPASGRSRIPLLLQITPAPYGAGQLRKFSARA